MSKKNLRMVKQVLRLYYRGFRIVKLMVELYHECSSSDQEVL